MPVLARATPWCWRTMCMALPKHLPTIMGALGIAAAFIAYLVRPDIPGRIVAVFKPIHTLFFRKWFFDELYNAVFVQPAQKLGHVCCGRRVIAPSLTALAPMA
jgi:NADH:ubiquinone oxidoreductase subunit 5 (subunit L)/multisubunit Na+/H+ antiporter MnhA subunit